VSEQIRPEARKEGEARVDRRSAGARQAESERKRQRILEAARACFGRLGYSGAKVETIAAEAGVSNGLLYQFFRGKDELFEVVVDELIRDWIQAMVPRGGEERQSSSAALESMFRNSIAFTTDHPLLPAVFTEDSLLQLSRFSDSGSRHVSPYREHVAGILRGGIASGEFREDLDVESTADIVCQLQIDYSTRAYRRDPDFPISARLIDTAVRFIHAAVKA